MPFFALRYVLTYGRKPCWRYNFQDCVLLTYIYIYICTQDKVDMRGVGSIVQVNSLLSTLCCLHCMLYKYNIYHIYI